MFTQFWNVYPRRVKKQSAQESLERILLSVAPEEQEALGRQIIEGAERYARDCQGVDPQFVAHPSTWLNGERWTDESLAESGPRAPKLAKFGEE